MFAAIRRALPAIATVNCGSPDWPLPTADIARAAGDLAMGFNPFLVRTLIDPLRCPLPKPHSGPPPFSSMNSTPATSIAVRVFIACQRNAFLLTEVEGHANRSEQSSQEFTPLPSLTTYGTKDIME